MNNISVVDSEKCYGCTSCVTRCHFSAIEMQENEKGFLNPVIDTGKCVNCGKCVKACPAIKLPNIDEYEQSFYAMKANDDSIRQKSTSGGAFSVLASCLAEKNAIVYGSVFERTGVKHIRVDDGDLELLRGSKYVPSNLNDTFLKIIEDLKSNKTVMFVGTPCQCGGLKKCISNTAVSSQNLYIIDFICHGTASPKLFEDYLIHCEKKRKRKITQHIFRSKKQGWHTHLEENVFEDGYRDNQSFESQLQRSIFYSGYAFSERCYSCEYSSTARCSDITIADFWGIEKAAPDFDDNKGTSFVIINTSKGRSLFDLASSQAEVLEVSLADTDQPHIKSPVERPAETDSFWDFYQKHGFDRMIAKYFAGGNFRRLLANIYHKLKGDRK